MIGLTQPIDPLNRFVVLLGMLTCVRVFEWLARAELVGLIDACESATDERARRCSRLEWVLELGGAADGRGPSWRGCRARGCSRTGSRGCPRCGAPRITPSSSTQARPCCWSDALRWLPGSSRCS